MVDIRKQVENLQTFRICYQRLQILGECSDVTWHTGRMQRILIECQIFSFVSTFVYMCVCIYKHYCATSYRMLSTEHYTDIPVYFMCVLFNFAQIFV